MMYLFVKSEGIVEYLVHNLYYDCKKEKKGRSFGNYFFYFFAGEATREISAFVLLFVGGKKGENNSFCISNP